MNLNAHNQIVLPENGRRDCENSDQTEETKKDGAMPPGSTSGGEESTTRTSLRARALAEGLSPHRDILLTAKNCDYLNKQALGKR